MNRLIPLVIAGFLAASGASAENDDNSLDLTPMDGGDVNLNDFLWVARPIVVFADTTADPRFIEQLELLAARPEELAARDVVIITDTDPSARSELRRELRPRGFMLVVIGKDGNRLRKPAPWDVREITRSIDKMPLRQEEIRLRKAPRPES